MGSNVPPKIPIRWPMTARRYGIATSALLSLAVSATLEGHGPALDAEQMAGPPG